MDIRLALAFLLLLGFCAEIKSYRIQQQDEPVGYLEQAKGMAYGSWQLVSSNAQDLMAKVKDVASSDGMMGILNKGTSLFTTYTDILGDQVIHWWHEL
ncbi:apolipoprotein C-II-like [Ambystoma mexicanum]|uniref:apolipoprotein C-II-like n=1 Tax=Ambystoma mexicanum TaxID=8296 RepID=UPI0037E854C4